MRAKTHNGFTVIEILIVIAVIGILAALSVVGYRGVTNRAEESKTQSNLSKAQEFIESQIQANGLYPSSLSGFNSDSGITLSYVPSSDFKTYCLSAASSKANTKTYKAVQEGKLSEGNCVEPPFDGPDDLAMWTCDNAVQGRASTRFTWSAAPNSTYPSFSVVVEDLQLMGQGPDYEVIGENVYDTVTNDQPGGGEFRWKPWQYAESMGPVRLHVQNRKPSGQLSYETVWEGEPTYTGTCNSWEE